MPTTAAPLVADDAKALAIQTLDAMRSGNRADFDGVCHPEFFNHEQLDEPPAARGRGPATAYATALWLRDAFAGLSWEVHSIVAEDDLVAVHCTMSGRHVNPFVAYARDDSVDEVFPPTGEHFATTQTHWLRIADGKAIEHWANRDDLGTAKQLGWVPPTPRYLVRMALAKRRARQSSATQPA